MRSPQSNILFLIIAFLGIPGLAQKQQLGELERYVSGADVEQASQLVSQIQQIPLNAAESAKFHYLHAKLALLENKDNLAYDRYIQSKKQYLSQNSLDTVAQINLEIASLLLAIDKSTVDYRPFLKEYIAYAKTQNNPDYLSKAYMQSGKSLYDRDPWESIRYFKMALAENSKTGDQLYAARIYQNLGATYASDKVNQPDSALQVYENAFRLFKQFGGSENLFYLYTNKGVAYGKLRKYDDALAMFRIADSLSGHLKEYNAKNREALYGYMAHTYKEMGDYKNALVFLDKQQVYHDILNEHDQRKALRDIDIKYKTREKELENLTLKGNIKRSKILFLIVSALLLVVAIISILAYKNISKKRKIAQQEKLIESQKLENVLKEQELHGIDLMLESQERERQRLANELHDNLGSMLATLKMNFEHLRKKVGPPNESADHMIFDKTNSLIDEAYQRVRNIAHLKNLGVIGSQGLLTAVKKMAEKMSILEKFQIHVIPFGLSERLENTLEVTLFRIIQELSTNIIKHSDASEVNIYLTQQSAGEMNIIVEDNGKGFDPKTIVKSEGIGLKGIEKKIEQLGGSFTIDSIIGKGTTIIIDIPL